MELNLADLPHVPQGHCGSLGPGLGSIPAMSKRVESSVAGWYCSPSEKVML